ncbi:Transcription elongation protein nusA [Metamycoplasma cloacale]|uniref:Transcription termination/antitermination protein NusA n=1 Tax=Metamycoplasma cloacale TaxID=92401 RepID=A0A2Z4LM98_9BACT|nr:transcription termination factor NusA [Metamycoplasma cloacale]AWX42902.1 transcription termination factor NusA [Metamycoplasma cloacale]VEU79274.1 Transcription elongation protein nusA [Metamycoplasma cloacale]
MPATDSIKKMKAQAIFTDFSNLSKIKKIEKQDIIEAFKNAVLKTIYDIYDEEADIEFIINEAECEFAVINKNKQVVPDPVSTDDMDLLARCVEIPLSIAQTIDKNAKLDSTIAEEIDFEEFMKKDFTRIQSIFNQSIRELEKNAIYNKYLSKVGQVVKAKFISSNANGIMLELEDMTTAFMPISASNKRLLNTLKLGNWIDVFIDKVVEDSKYAQVVVSSIDTKILMNLLNKEIPEIAQGIIEVVNIARISGERSKICIRKSENAPVGIEEIGSIIGANASRIEAISRQLNNEKIDVVLYTDDLKQLIINALSPAKVIDVIEKKGEGKYPSFTVIVPTLQHTLAIGRKGQNVSLATELTKAKIDIISQKEADEKGISYNFDHGNITAEEIQNLSDGKKLQSNFKRKRATNSTPKASSIFDSAIDMSEFEDEIAELRSKVVSSDSFERQILGDSYYDNESFNETLEQVKKEFDEDENNGLTEFDNEPFSQDLTEDYEKIASTKLKDFKEDKELTFGLEGIDLSDLEDEDW